MPIHPGRAAAALLLTFSLSPLLAQTPAETPMPTPQTPTTAPAPADLTLGGFPILRLRGVAGGLSPEQRIDVIMGRLTPLLGVPNIQPSDVVVFLPSQTSRVNRAPVIYALGRRLITVDPATVKAAGGGDTMTVATRWAKRLQQVLPRVNWRPPNAPEPKVPANPPLTITGDFTQVGGMIGTVALRGKVVLKLRGPQTGGLTAAERADLLTARLNRLADGPGASAPDAVQVALLPNSEAQISLAGTPLVTVTQSDAAAAGFTQPSQLANGWAKNLRAVLAAPPSPEMPILPTPASPVETPPVPAPPAPTAPATPAAPSAPAALPSSTTMP